MATMNKNKPKAQNIKDIDNLWEFLAFVFTKPKILIGIGIFTILIILLLTTRWMYDSNKKSFIMQKKSVDIEKIIFNNTNKIEERK